MFSFVIYTNEKLRMFHPLKLSYRSFSRAG